MQKCRNQGIHKSILGLIVNMGVYPWVRKDGSLDLHYRTMVAFYGRETYSNDHLEPSGVKSEVKSEDVESEAGVADACELGLQVPCEVGLHFRNSPLFWLQMQAVQVRALGPAFASSTRCSDRSRSR